MRWIADRDAVSAAWLPGLIGRPHDVPERYDLHSLDLAARNGMSPALGLLDRVLATNCPPFRTMGLDLGAFQLIGEPPAADGVAEICVPRRTVLDKILVDAAAEPARR